MKPNKEIIQFLRKSRPEMFRLLKDLVLIQSGSRHKAGVDRVARRIQSAFQENSVTCRLDSQKTFGDHLIVRSKGHQSGSKQILMVGHMDTVFPKDTDFNTYREDDLNSYGPGVCDMKGGLVVGIYALKALDAAGLLQKLPITFVFNSDEEIGSASSEDLIAREARRSAFAFVFECGGPDGEVVTGRKGNLSIRLDLRGRSGHAAFAGPDKMSAVLELAHKTIAIEAINDFAKGITANVGKIEGGIGPNTVPERASALIDFRVVHQSEFDQLIGRIDAIVKSNTIAGVTSAFEIVNRRDPMPMCTANTRLFDTVREVAEVLGIFVKNEFRKGVSDANIIGGEGIPVIDGLGPIGARDHSPDEYMVKESLLDRTLLAACSLVACWERRRSG